MKKLLLIAFVSFAALPAFAGGSPFFKGEVQGKTVEQGLPKIVKNIGIDQKLGDSVTLSLPVRDESGAVTTLGAYFGKHPVILVMSYYGCPNLCTMVMNGVFGAIKALPYEPGKEYDVVTVSIDPTETAAMASKKKESYLGGFHQGEHAAGFHFLTAEQPTIDILTKQVGFRYAYDSASKQYAHASGIMVLTPGGRLSRYFYGIEYSPKDLKYGIMDASGGKIGSVADKLLLYCYHYDPATGKYGAAITTMLRIGGGLTLLAMGAMFMVFRRRSKMKLNLLTGGVTG